MRFDNIDELREWLTAVPINMAAWGRDGAKSVEALWQEIVLGETEIQADPPQRQVQLVEFVIRQGDKVLIEAAQELADGQIRQRDILPAEKMKVGEEVETAVRRGLGEELGVASEDVTILGGSYRQYQRLRDSPSYPGLPTHYSIHSFAVQVEGLPEGDFWRDNAVYGQDDPVKRHYWVWEPVSVFGNP
jgi:hypothetical protein